MEFYYSLPLLSNVPELKFSVLTKKKGIVISISGPNFELTSYTALSGKICGLTAYHCEDIQDLERYLRVNPFFYFLGKHNRVEIRPYIEHIRETPYFHRRNICRVPKRVPIDQLYFLLIERADTYLSFRYIVNNWDYHETICYELFTFYESERVREKIGVLVKLFEKGDFRKLSDTNLIKIVIEFMVPKYKKIYDLCYKEIKSAFLDVYLKKVRNLCDYPKYE